LPPATRERISTRSTASSRPENSSHGTVSRGTTTETETGSAAGAAAAASAWALPFRTLRKLAPAAMPKAANHQRGSSQAFVLDDIFHGRPQFEQNVWLRTPV